DNETTLLKLADSTRTADLAPATATLLAETLISLNERDKAAQVLREVQSKHPDDFTINRLLAGCLEKEPPSFSEDTIRFYQAALAIRPQSMGVLQNLATELNLAGRKDEALALYRRGAQLHPQHHIAQYHLGMALDKAGRIEEAIAPWKEAIR